MKKEKRNENLRIFFVCVCMLFCMGICSSVFAATEEEGNDTIGTANHISCNTVISGNNETNKDVDYYKFTLVSAGKVSISFGHENLTDARNCWNIRLYDENTKECVYLVSAGTDTSLTSGEVGLPAGNYYIRVNTWDGEYSSAFPSNAPYRLRVNYEASEIWEREENGNFLTANPINVGRTYYGACQYMSDLDYYKFTLASAGCVSVSFGHENLTDARTCWDVRLYDENTKERVYLGSAGTDTSLTSGAVGLPAGNYYIRVNTSNGYYSDAFPSEATYQFRVNYEASEVWEKEENGSFLTANPINVGTTYYGACQYMSDIDYYKFTLTSAGSASVSFSHENLTDARNCWDIRLYDEDTKECVYLGSAGTDISLTSGEVGLPAGNYYVRVNTSNGYYSGSFPSEATYRFCVNYKQSDVWETEDNGTYAAADLVASGITYSGAIQYSNDIDFYKFSLKKTEYVRIALEHERAAFTDELWVVKVIDSGTRERITLESAGTDKSKTSTGVYLTPGDYYVKIAAGSRYYGTIPYYFSILTGTAEQHKDETEGTKEDQKQETSKVPTSEKPTSKEPTSEKPTSKEPTSKKPTSKKPTSEKPTVKKNKTYNNGNGKYTVLSVSGNQATVAYAPKKRAIQTVTIPDMVVINGVKCKVVAIKAKAFKNNTNLRKVTIGSNVIKIGAQAFYGCRRLNKLVIKTKRLTAGKIGSKAFTKAGGANYRKLIVKVPKKQCKYYKKILKKKGLSSKAKISNK